MIILICPYKHGVELCRIIPYRLIQAVNITSSEYISFLADYFFILTEPFHHHRAHPWDKVNRIFPQTVLD